MENKILTNNETAYMTRYGVSLQEQLDILDYSKIKNSCRHIMDYMSGSPENSIRYDKDAILRIMIGYRGQAFLEHIIFNTLPSTRVLIWEPDSSLFLAGCILEDISAYISDERFTIVFGHDEFDYLKKIINENLFDHNMNHIALSATGDYTKDNNEYVNDFRRMLTEIVREKTFTGNMRKLFGSMPYENYLYAIHALNNNYTIDQLVSNIEKKDIPIIIVSAGPSLEHNCTELKNAKGKALIVAITHSMKTLSSMNIIPDMIAVTDPQKMDFMDFDTERNYYLLCDAYASRYDQECYNGKIVYYGFTAYEGLFTTGRISGGINPELATGSVSTDVFSLFVEAGFKRFILVGQDLSYDNEGHTHTGSYSEQGYCENTGLFIETEGIYGGTVRTRFDWDRFRKYFEMRIASLPNVEVIDATEGGALIHGTKVMRLKDAISEYCKTSYPVSEWFDCLSKGTLKELHEVKRWFDDNLFKAGRLLDMLNEILSINSMVTNAMIDPRSWNDEVSASCKRYDVLYRIIMEGNDGELLRLYCKPEVQQYLEDAMTVENLDDILPRMKLEHDLFDSLKQKATEMIGYMEDLTQRLPSSQ